MKLYQILMVAVLTTTVFYGSAAAEYQDDRIFGNGRFLRRLRNDVSKKVQPKPKEAQPSKNGKVNPRGKTPTPAVRRPTGKTPTPAVRTGQRSNKAASPTPAVRPGKSIPSTQLTNRAIAPRPNANLSGSKQHKSARTVKQPPTDFGMQLDLKSEKFVVTRIDPRGNAQKAGLKKGDVILKAGGTELGSLEEFEEITKILDQGDELEFVVDRRGKKSEMMIQFGTAIEASEVSKTSQPKKENDYSFVPEGDDNSQTGLHSVLGHPVQVAGQSASTARPAGTQRTVEQQRRQIEQMQREIEWLKRQSQFVPASAGPTVNPPRVGTVPAAPRLSGPGS